MKKIILFGFSFFSFCNSSLIAQYVADSKLNNMLDDSFSKNGKVTTNINGSYYNNESQIKSVMLQKDGKIIVAGNSARYIDNDIFLARYLSNGIIDTSFGINGFIQYKNANSNDYIYQAQLQSDGKIIATARKQGTSCLLRFLSNGIIDLSFGTNGIVKTAQPAYSIDIDKNDKIIVSEKYYDYTKKKLILALQCFNKNGSPDLKFGKNNFSSITVNPDFTSYYYLTEPSKIKLYQENKIVVASSWQSTYNTRDIVVARFNLNGTIDSSFNNTGLLAINGLNGFFSLSALTFQFDKIIIGGSLNHQRFLLTRVRQNGKIDKGFGINGFVTTTFPYKTEYSKYDELSTLCIQEDKKIIAAGSSISSYFLYGLFAVCRYNVNGSIDTTFGNSGFVKTQFGYSKDSRARDAIIQSDGKIIVAGYHDTVSSQGGIGGHIAIARYNQEKTILANFSLNNSLKDNEYVFSVFPNPAKNNLQIHGFEVRKKYTLKIIDELGRVVLLKYVNYSNSYTLNIQGLKSGIYNIGILSDKTTSTLSFVKE